MHITQNKLLKTVLYPVVLLTEWVGKTNPTLLMKIRYFARLHKRLDLNNPRTLNEKILFLSLRTDTESWTRLADKYAVRSYVKECGLEEILTELYAYWTSETEVDFNALPNSFVIKSVQGCGDAIIVKDKTQLDKNEAARAVHRMLHERYGALEGGRHYLRIKLGVIVEELLPIKNDESPIDYKIWCFNGKVAGIMTCSSRTDNSVCLGFYDIDWGYHPENMIFSEEHPEEPTLLPKPKNLDKMISVAEKLSTGFPCVRVDLYNFEGKIYFGEMTFTSFGGIMDYYSEEFQLLAGAQIDLSGVKIIK